MLPTGTGSGTWAPFCRWVTGADASEVLPALIGFLWSGLCERAGTRKPLACPGAPLATCRSGGPRQLYRSNWDTGRRHYREPEQVWVPRLGQVNSPPRGPPAEPNKWGSATLYMRPRVSHPPLGAIQHPLPRGDSSPMVPTPSHRLLTGSEEGVAHKSA